MYLILNKKDKDSYHTFISASSKIHNYKKNPIDNDTLANNNVILRITREPILSSI